jgi:hypothetical protein
MKGYCDNCGKVIDETEIVRFGKLIICRGCYSKLNKKELCQICKLNETCQNNFDYECIEASDFLFKPKSKIYTVKDDFLDSLTNKDNKALRG